MTDSPTHPAYSMQRHLSGGSVWLAVCTIVALQTGCRGKAHQDLYREQLTSELRELEDRLYQADYQNQVLAQKLHRAQLRLQEQQGDQPDAAPPPSFDFEPDDRRDARDADLSDETEAREVDPPLIEPGLDLDSDSLIDPGEPMRPEEMDSLPSQGDGDADGLSSGEENQSQRRESIATPQGELPPSPESRNEPEPPSEPEPPGASDLTFPPIDEGDVAPPSDANGGVSSPPGQIPFDESFKVLGLKPKAENESEHQPDSTAEAAQESGPPSVPTGLKLHPSLSGLYRFDAHPDEEDESKDEGLMLVVTAVDDGGATVDLASFDVEAEMTVVVLDPQREAEAARLGRWEFSPTTVRQLIANRPVSGLHVPVRWQSDRPLGKEVIVHVRLESEGQRMQCEGRIKLQPSESVAQWTPRGEASSPRR